MTDRGLISPDDAAKLLGVSRRTVDRQISLYGASKGAEGIGPKYEIARNVVRVPIASVRDWVERSRRVGDPKRDAPIF